MSPTVRLFWRTSGSLAAWHYTIQNYTALQCIMPIWKYTTLHYNTLHCTAMHCITELRCITLQCTALNTNALHYSLTEAAIRLPILEDRFFFHCTAVYWAGLSQKRLSWAGLAQRQSENQRLAQLELKQSLNIWAELHLGSEKWRIITWARGSGEGEISCWTQLEQFGSLWT